jgi:hypothetical protein
MIQAGACFKQQERILTQEVSGSVVLFNMESGRYYSLNDVGTRTWELCDGLRSVSEVMALLAEEYDASTEMIREDVMNLLVELRDENLVVEVPPPA